VNALADHSIGPRHKSRKFSHIAPGSFPRGCFPLAEGILQALIGITAEMGPTEITQTSAVPKVATAMSAAQARVHKVATQFEAMFMTEMLHQAHGKSHAAGVFRTGEGESTMQPFMDQAFGDAAASRGGAGIAKSIEKLLNGPQAVKAQAAGTSK
jgi:peptidoglycan hydrolase FlgJ